MYSETFINRGLDGQRKDDSGLLFSNARYYDSVLARFLSADTVVPGNAMGGMAGVAYRPLTVTFHEAGFAERLNHEHAMGLPFAQDSRTRQQAGTPWGPVNPQALNRYGYVMGNPIKYVDPSGHEAGTVVLIGIGMSVPIAAAIVGALALAVILWCISDSGCRDWVMTQIQAGVNNAKDFIDGITGAYATAYEERETDVGKKRVRKLSDSEVDQTNHARKGKRQMGATDSYYVDEDGNLYAGRDSGELTSVTEKTDRNEREKDHRRDSKGNRRGRDKRRE